MTQSQGRLGTLHAPVEGGYLVEGVIADSPAEQTEMPIEVGDLITAIDFERFAEGEVPTTTVESLLKGRIGDEVVVTVAMEAPVELVVVMEEEEQAAQAARMAAPSVDDAGSPRLAVTEVGAVTGGMEEM